jgi:hypothetical protein
LLVVDRHSDPPSLVVRRGFEAEREGAHSGPQLGRSDVPACWARPSAAGGTPVMLNLYVEDVPPEERQSRAAEAMGD